MKKLLSLFIVLFGLTSFGYCVDSYTCSYQGILNDVSRNYGISTTYYLSNCNDFGGIYDCTVFADISTTNGNCYQIGGFDLSNYDDISIDINNGGSYVSFSSSNNNLDKLDGYTVCNPNRLVVQGRVYSYVPDLPYTITSFPEYAFTNYSYTYTCPTCSQCDYSGYILESEVTQNYCEVRYNLIDPGECPASGGTGDINWSSFFVNNYQVQGARNIYLFMPDFLTWDYTYIDSGNTLNIEVENEGDEEYIQGIIDINSYRPSSEDFTNIFVSGLTLIMPYIVVALFIIFVWKLIKKIFR